MYTQQVLTSSDHNSDAITHMVMKETQQQTTRENMSPTKKKMQLQEYTD